MAERLEWFITETSKSEAFHDNSEISSEITRLTPTKHPDEWGGRDHCPGSYAFPQCV